MKSIMQWVDFNDSQNHRRMRLLVTARDTADAPLVYVDRDESGLAHSERRYWMEDGVTHCLGVAGSLALVWKWDERTGSWRGGGESCFDGRSVSRG